MRDAAHLSPYTIGEMAHIRGENPGSNRHDENQTAEQRNDYENLILLCPNHHTLIDKRENEGLYMLSLCDSCRFFAFARLARKCLPLSPTDFG